MKELSLLMFFIALIFGLTVFVSSLFRSKNPDDSAFYIPSRGLFNIIWGSIFYIGYGMLMFPQPLITFTLGLINGALIFYALFLVRVKNFLLKPQRKGAAFICRYLQKQLDRCRENDSDNQPYSYRKALKILGLPAYTTAESEDIAVRLQILHELEQSGKLPHPYLPELVSKTQQAVK